MLHPKVERHTEGKLIRSRTIKYLRGINRLITHCSNNCVTDAQSHLTHSRGAQNEPHRRLNVTLHLHTLTIINGG